MRGIIFFLVAFCDGFVVTNNKLNPKLLNTRLKRNVVTGVINMVYRPSELIKQVARGGLGDEWTYNDFVTNLQNHNVDAATLTNTDNMVVIDKNYALEVKPENLHLLQGVPQLTDNLINKLVENHINFLQDATISDRKFIYFKICCIHPRCCFSLMSD